MATTTAIVEGKFYDGVTSATAGYVAKKINDITTGAASFSFAICRRGNRVIAVIVYS
jgi:hypothetical protein